MIFDGRVFAKEIEIALVHKVQGSVKKPHIVSILVGEDPASVLYTGLKQKAAERVGIEFEVVKIGDEGSRISVKILKQQIAEIGERENIGGMMIQMPLLRRGSGGQAIPFSREETADVISAIPLDKDVDGLRWEESGVMPATVKAIISVLQKIDNQKIWDKQFVVVGSHGSVGKPLLHFLKERGVKHILEVNSQETHPEKIILLGEVVISCVGKAGLITETMVKPGIIAIDVGISKVNGKTVGDMTNGVYNAASVAVPVPGGIGPITVASLMENAYESNRVLFNRQEEM